jgi:outer membrane cobalamin receptor
MIGTSVLSSVLIVGLLAQSEALPQGAPQSTPPADQSPLPTVSENVIVTTTRVGQDPEEATVNVTVLTRDDIERSNARTVDELLREVTGFSQLRQSASHAAHPTVRSAALRGLGGSSNSRTLVLVDGVPLNEPFGGVVFWSRVPLDSIERIEIVKGGASGVWGNLALGGVIHIITRPLASAQPAVRLMAEGGNLGTANAGVGLQGGRGALRAAVNVNGFRTSGYRIVHPDQAGPVDVPVEDATLAVSTKVEYHASPRAVWTVGGDIYREDQASGTPLAQASVEVGAFRAGGDVTTAGGSRWHLTSYVIHQNVRSQSSSVAVNRASETLASDQHDVPATAGGVNLQWSKPLTRRHLVAAGIDAQWIDAVTNEYTNFASGAFTRERRLGGRQQFSGMYVEDLFEITARWRVVAAARIDRWALSDGERREVEIASGAVVTDTRYPHQTRWTFNPSVGLVHQASSRVTVRTATYRAFRAPASNELFRPFRARGNVITESNAELTPERLTGVEGGADVEVAEGLRLKLTAFLENLDDPVTTRTVAAAGAAGRTIAPCGFVPAGGVCRLRDNLGRLRSVGIESDVTYRAGTAWAFSGNYLFNRSRIVEAPNDPDLVGTFNKHSPVHQMSLTASYEKPETINAWLMGRYVSSRFEDDLNSLQIADFFLIDVRVARPLSSTAEVYLSVQNLFDRTYETSRAADGTVAIGSPRLVNAGMRLRF